MYVVIQSWYEDIEEVFGPFDTYEEAATFADIMDGKHNSYFGVYSVNSKIEVALKGTKD